MVYTQQNSAAYKLNINQREMETNAQMNKLISSFGFQENSEEGFLLNSVNFCLKFT